MNLPQESTRSQYVGGDEQNLFTVCPLTYTIAMLKNNANSNQVAAVFYVI